MRRAFDYNCGARDCIASVFLWAALVSAGAADIPIPRVNDARLEIQLLAAEPRIVTPIGIAIDERNLLYVVESHTHLQAKDYPGPKGDLIKIFDPGERRAEPRIFAEGLQKAMNLAFSPSGELYVVCATEVFRLEDRDKDGVSETRTRVLNLNTTETYPHNSLLGITFSPDGWMYIARGNTGGRIYRFEGTDGSEISGFGDGGSIVRCRADGSQLEAVATGFWNPFDIKFDYAGRLLCVDNDPDARGPNRLVDVVMDGDYGYRSLYGGSGLHPYQSWEGELPGTLPMAAPLGEAPSGVLDCSRSGLPKDYRRDVLSTIWGEHTVVRTHLAPKGVSIAGTNSVLIEGTQEFRPVGIDTDSQGNIYITDWVDREYPNHGKGRIWKLRAKEGVAELNVPRRNFTRLESNTAGARLDQVRKSTEWGELGKHLQTPDPFLRSAAVTALAREGELQTLQSRLINHERDEVRLGCLLALRKAGAVPDALVFRRLFRDSSEEVRRMALVWTGEAFKRELADELDSALHGGAISPRLLETYLATLQILNSNAEELLARRVRGYEIKRDLSPAQLEKIVFDPDKPLELRRMVLPRLSASSVEARLKQLIELARTGPEEIRSSVIRALVKTDSPAVTEFLLETASRPEHPGWIRAEAVQAVATQSPGSAPRLGPYLATAREPELQNALARALRTAGDESEVRQELEKTLQKCGDPRVSEQLEFALGRAPARPATAAEWEEAAGQGGDARFGEMVFFAGSSTCAQCHRVRGEGGTIGPDLTYIGRSANRAQLLRSILQPSDDIAPQFQGWSLETTDGETHLGLQLHHKSGGAIELIDLTGTTVRFPGNKIAGYSAMKSSLMPAGLEQTMTVQDLRDLLAFLESLR